MLLEERVGQPTTEAEAEQLALELYGLHVVAKALPGEYDDNFHLTVKSALADQAKLANSVAPKPANPSPPAAVKSNYDEFIFSPASSEGGGEFEAVADVGNDAIPQTVDHPAPDAPPQPVTPFQPPAGTDFV